MTLKVIISIACLLPYGFMSTTFAQNAENFIASRKIMCEYNASESPDGWDSMICNTDKSMVKPPRFSIPSGITYNSPRPAILLLGNEKISLHYRAYLPSQKKALLKIVDGIHTSNFIFPTPFDLKSPKDNFISIEKISSDLILFTHNAILFTDKNQPDGYWFKFFYIYDRKEASLVSVFHGIISLEDPSCCQYVNLSATKNNGAILFKVDRLTYNTDTIHIYFKFKLNKNAEHGIDCIDTSGGNNCTAVETLKKIKMK